VVLVQVPPSLQRAQQYGPGQREDLLLEEEETLQPLNPPAGGSECRSTVKPDRGLSAVDWPPLEAPLESELEEFLVNLHDVNWFLTESDPLQR